YQTLTFAPATSFANGLCLSTCTITSSVKYAHTCSSNECHPCGEGCETCQTLYRPCDLVDVTWAFACSQLALNATRHASVCERREQVTVDASDFSGAYSKGRTTVCWYDPQDPSGTLRFDNYGE